MSRNINNQANPTNFICGSSALEISNMYCVSLNLPSITLNSIYLNNGSGSPLNITGDNLIYAPVQIELVVDENYDVYFEIMEKLVSKIGFVDGNFTDFSFDFFIEVTNSLGEHIFKLTLINARLQTIGDLNLDTRSEETTMILPIELVFDYPELERSGKVYKLGNLN